MIKAKTKRKRIERLDIKHPPKQNICLN
jgi:hypothetical protein